MSCSFECILSGFKTESAEVHYENRWIQLAGWLSLKALTGDIAYKKTSGIMKQSTNYIHTISQTPYTLDKLRSLWQASHIDFGEWSILATMAIDHFHSSLRSLMDIVAWTLSEVAKKSGQLPKSFYDLKSSKNIETLLGSKIAERVQGTGWFDEIRTVRDSLIHRNAYTLMFDEHYEILFQTYIGFESVAKRHPSLMYNENVINGKIYIGYYSASALAFLHHLASDIVALKYWFPGFVDQRLSGPSLSVLEDWIRKTPNIDFCT